METKVNYVLVGIFTLALSAAFIAGVLWLSAGKRSNLPYDIYMADMQESVSGLNLNAPVKYRGVEVGQVRKISLNKAKPEQIRLELAIERGIPIKQDTIASLKSQGLTGISFIELSGGSSASPLLEATQDEPYPVIKTGASLLGRLDASMSGLLSSLSKTAENANAVLDEDNRKKFKQTLANIEALTGTLAAHRTELDTMLGNTAHALESVEKMTKEASRASSSLRRTLDDIGPDAARFANEGLPELERMMVTMRETLASLQRVTEQIEKNPGMLLRGKELPPPGPGE